MANSEQPLILVADDEPSTLALVSNHLRGRGFRVIEATDGDEAWDLACRELPDLVVLDVMMPGMSGWEVCRKIRDAVSLAHTGVIMLTGIGDTLNELTSPLYGADAYLDKPFQFQKLQDLVAETLKNRERGSLGRPEKTSGPSTRLFKSSLSDDAPESSTQRRPRSEAPGAEGKSKTSKKNGAHAEGAVRLAGKKESPAKKEKAPVSPLPTEPKPLRKARPVKTETPVPPAPTPVKESAKKALAKDEKKSTPKPAAKTPKAIVKETKKPATKKAAKKAPAKKPAAPAKPAKKAPTKKPAPVKAAPAAKKAAKKAPAKKPAAPAKPAKKAPAKKPAPVKAAPAAKKAPAKKPAAPVKTAPKKAAKKAKKKH